ncbi:MAG: L-2-amino-thiazoline-4-carboxylic acid hydrolase [Treponema sp.]|nr:L-2-amino-thiazoline-4-carboxylic acid hydrolase [Treponema sp.]
MKNKFEKLLTKGRLAKAYNELPDNQCRADVIREYKALLNSSSCNNKMLYKHLACSILPAAAVYRVLQNNGFDKDTAINIIRESVLYAGQNMKKLLQKLGKLPFFFLLFRILCRNSLKNVYGKPGWDMRWLADTPYELRWDCHSCFYHDELKKHDAQELLAVFCASDDLIYGDIPNIQWGRKKTLAAGSEVCDFQFYNAKTNRASPKTRLVLGKPQ